MLFRQIVASCVLVPAAVYATDESTSLVSIFRRNIGVEGAVYDSSKSISKEDCTNFKHPSWLQDCKQIYLDIGSNMGVQVRKFFEAEQYPDAPVLPLFEDAFGTPEQRRAVDSGICVLGVEPNPRFAERLLAIEEAYNKKGWRTHFYQVAAWDEFDTMTFKNLGVAGVAGTLMAEGETGGLGFKNTTDVCTVDMSVFMSDLPSGTVKLAKMDIEGAEWHVVPKMRAAGQFCNNVVDTMFMETHWGMGRFVGNVPYTGKMTEAGVNEYVQEGMQNCEKTKVIRMDDETYMTDNHDNSWPFAS